MTTGELTTWGYFETSPGAVFCDMKNYWSVDTACKDLGLDTRPKLYGGSNLCYRFQHFNQDLKDAQGAKVYIKDQKYNVDGKEYRSTGADIEIAVNPVQGVIFQQYVNSPKTMARNIWNKEPSNDELPKLRALSDVMWGAWNRDNSNLKNIHYFWVQGVGNTRTKAAIARALKSVNKSLEKWPGTTFSMSDDAGLALLGSENGACFGFFLATHKAELGGNLYIEKVTVFRKDGSGNVDPDLVFHVKDASSKARF
ncbi:hypothetical protein P280DRAFT_463555 [Massarina eburnea CBS 473.64]|uniref:Uncharacterized protein n=1 Tax=Massarina eburnea CBS 473.64 TaxID=1395130 RepID=A0A6A6RHC0_9PLEO|nr:hypothetical protein P280DRAFT_463555 [Massarina eburnea CBS 473.64]